MNFDKLAKAVERTTDLQHLLPLMNDARLFDFGSKGPGDAESDDLDDVAGTDTFFLPFDTTAIETPRYVALLHDLDPDANVLGARRQFALCVNAAEWVAHEVAVSQSADLESLAIELHGSNWWLIMHGYTEASPVPQNSDDQPMEACGSIWRFDGREAAAWATLEFSLEPAQTQLCSVVDAVMRETIANILLINRPVQEFIVEASPLKEKQPPPERILRSQDRPQYTVLKPDAIRKVMGLPSFNMNGTKKTPHERRAHVRTLRSDFFCHKQGQQILIPSSWIGPSENIVGNKRYRVILE